MTASLSFVVPPPQTVTRTHYEIDEVTSAGCLDVGKHFKFKVGVTRFLNRVEKDVLLHHFVYAYRATNTEYPTGEWEWEEGIINAKDWLTGVTEPKHWRHATEMHNEDPEQSSHIETHAGKTT